MGGMIKVSAQIRNVGTTNITRIAMQLNTLAGFSSAADASTWHGTLAPGASITLTWDVDFAAGDLNRDLNMTLLADNDPDMDYDETQTEILRVTGEENVMRSGGEAVPEKDVYYVGETVTVTDTMRNSLPVEATNVTMEYYFRLTGGGTDFGDTVDIGTIAGGDTHSQVLEYTFTSDDIGILRIGSELTYYVMGRGPYNEFNVARDFIVEPAPTPTPTEAPTPTPSPAPTPSPTPEPSQDSASPSPDDAASLFSQEVSPVQEGTASDTPPPADEVSRPNTFLLIVIVVLAVMLLAAIIVLIVVLAKKRRDDFG
jgi:hypothetical protein